MGIPGEEGPEQSRAQRYILKTAREASQYQVWGGNSNVHQGFKCQTGGVCILVLPLPRSVT